MVEDQQERRKRSRSPQKKRPGFNAEGSARFVEKEWPRLEDFMNRPAPKDLMGITWMNLRGPLNRLAGYPEKWWEGDPLDLLLPSEAPAHPPYRRKAPFTMLIPAGFVVCTQSGVEWRPSVGNETSVYRRTYGHDGAASPTWVDNPARKRLEEHWSLVLALAWGEEAIRLRIKVCAGCHKYRLSKKAKMRQKVERAYTCSDRCLKAWQGSKHRKAHDRAMNAQRQKLFRSAHARRNG